MAIWWNIGPILVQTKKTLLSCHIPDKFRCVAWPSPSCLVIVHYQNEREAGSVSLPQWCLGSFGGTGLNQQIHQSSKNAAAVQLLCTGCTNSDSCCGAAFLLGILFVLPLQTIPSAFALLIPTQVPTRFGNAGVNVARPFTGKVAPWAMTFGLPDGDAKDGPGEIQVLLSKLTSLAAVDRICEEKLAVGRIAQIDSA